MLELLNVIVRGLADRTAVLCRTADLRPCSRDGGPAQLSGITPNQAGPRFVEGQAVLPLDTGNLGFVDKSGARLRGTQKLI
jgi:hypothetical protein